MALKYFFCVFLLTGKGPCMFPPAVRPEVCITTFCTEVELVKQEIWKVKFLFMKLNLYLFFLKAKMLINQIYSHMQTILAKLKLF
jgi:hypothetical protein